MRLVADNVPDLIWAKDMQDRFLFVTRPCVDKLLLCGGPDEAEGRTDMFLPNENVERVSSIVLGGLR